MTKQTMSVEINDQKIDKIKWKKFLGLYRNASSETQAQPGAGKSLKTGEKKFGRRKVKNAKKTWLFFARIFFARF